MSIKTATLNGVATLEIARPEKKNALTVAMYEAMRDALVAAKADNAVRAVLITGQPGIFTSGNDIGDFAAIASGQLPPSEMHVHAFLKALATAEKPYVAAVQGLAVGIGTTMLMHCDLVYVADDAKLTTPFVNLALVPEAASSWLIPARIGHARAFAMFALGEAVDGRTAASIGLANTALPAAQVREKALEVAKTLARRPAGALRATKKLMRDSAQLTQLMDRELQVFAKQLKSAEASEAFRAFAERRAPDFTKLQD